MTNEEAANVMEKYTEKYCGKTISKVVSDAHKMAIIALERDRWIPVTESPKNDDTYLVTMDGEICGQEEPLTSMCGYFDGKWDEDCVIAWRPLPEPYHPQKLNNADEDTAQGGLQPAT